MNELIYLVIAAVAVAVAAWGVYRILAKSKAPLPAYWIVGAIFIVAILILLSRFI